MNDPKNWCSEPKVELSGIPAGITLFLGGARSGKSRRAEQFTVKLSECLGLPVCYIATAENLDAEMDARIKRHRESRPAHWETLEAPYEIVSQIETRLSQGQCIFLLDCLTVLISNWVLKYESQGLEGDQLTVAVLKRVDELVAVANSSQTHFIIVSNETGMGVVPPYPLGRVFRDTAGWANQKVADSAQRVYFVIAGKVLDLRKLEVCW